MTTLNRPAESAGGTPPATPPSRSSWSASWRVSLRMARRDVRRHRGRSLVVLLMVGVPTMLICAALTIAATNQISDAELVPRLMGPAEAVVEAPRLHPIVQGANPSTQFNASDAPARDIPGYDPAGDARANTHAISSLTGETAVPWGEGRASARVDDRLLRLRALVLPGADRFPGKVELVSGRWPTGEDEVLVSPAAVERGVPDSGPLPLSVPSGGTHGVTVVGTATATGTWGTYEIVVGTPDVLAAGAPGGWFLLGEDPVRWPEVQRLNGYGLVVGSAQVLRDPPATAEIDPRIAMGLAADNRSTLTAVTLGATLLLLTITLLVGPAFAVGATRQRRMLALVASNGATSQQLRRTVLAQALVLGGLSAVLGAVLAIPLGRAAVSILQDRGSTMGPFDVPWLQLLGIVVIAVAAATIAALLPAQRLTRLDIVGAMRGRLKVTRPSGILFGVGQALAIAGGFVIILGAAGGASPFALSAGAVALVLGTLLLVPTILYRLGRIGGHLPLPLRLAVRDLSRHRSRSTPTVAAVLAGTAALTVGLVGATSDDAQRRAGYVPANIPGEATLSLDVNSDASAVSAARTTVAEVAPGLVVMPWTWIDPPNADGPPAEWEDFVAAVPSGCSVADTLQVGPAQPMQEPSCRSTLSTLAQRPMLAMPVQEIVRRFELTGPDAAAVDDGAALLLTGDHTEGLVTDEAISVAIGQRHTDFEPGRPTRTREVTRSTLPVVTRPASRENLGRAASATLIVPSVVAKDWPTRTPGLFLRDPHGPIDDVTVQRIEATGAGWVSVERGVQNPLGLMIAVLLAAFTVLLLVVTLTSTALSLAEQSRDQATLAAVGAGRRTRRLMAGSQTLLLALIGVVLGVAVGIVPGIAIAVQLTAANFDPATLERVTGGATIAVPWGALAVMTVAVPLLAGVIAAMGIRRAPDVTQRAQ